MAVANPPAFSMSDAMHYESRSIRSELKASEGRLRQAKNVLPNNLQPSQGLLLEQEWQSVCSFTAVDQEENVATGNPYYEEMRTALLQFENTFGYCAPARERAFHSALRTQLTECLSIEDPAARDMRLRATLKWFHKHKPRGPSGDPMVMAVLATSLSVDVSDSARALARGRESQDGDPSSLSLHRPLRSQVSSCGDGASEYGGGSGGGGNSYSHIPPKVTTLSVSAAAPITTLSSNAELIDRAAASSAAAASGWVAPLHVPLSSVKSKNDFMGAFTKTPVGFGGGGGLGGSLGLGLGTPLDPAKGGRGSEDKEESFFLTQPNPSTASTKNLLKSPPSSLPLVMRPSIADLSASHVLPKPLGPVDVMVPKRLLGHQKIDQADEIRNPRGLFAPGSRAATGGSGFEGGGGGWDGKPRSRSATMGPKTSGSGSVSAPPASIIPAKTWMPGPYRGKPAPYADQGRGAVPLHPGYPDPRSASTSPAFPLAAKGGNAVPLYDRPSYEYDEEAAEVEELRRRWAQMDAVSLSSGRDIRTKVVQWTLQRARLEEEIVRRQEASRYANPIHQIVVTRYGGAAGGGGGGGNKGGRGRDGEGGSSHNGNDNDNSNNNDDNNNNNNNDNRNNRNSSANTPSASAFTGATMARRSQPTFSLSPYANANADFAAASAASLFGDGGGGDEGGGGGGGIEGGGGGGGGYDVSSAMLRRRHDDIFIHDRSKNGVVRQLGRLGMPVDVDVLDRAMRPIPDRPFLDCIAALPKPGSHLPVTGKVLVTGTRKKKKGKAKKKKKGGGEE